MTNWHRPLPHTHDKNVDKYNVQFVPLWGVGGVSTIAVDSDATTVAEDFLRSSGAGNPSYGYVTDSGIVGLRIDQAGDDVRFIWPIPWDCDVKSPINFAVMWSSDQTTTTDTFTWKVLYTDMTVDATTIDGAPATALSTAIAADYNVGTAWALQQTPWGVINGGTLTNGHVLKMLVECDATSGGSLGSDEVLAYFLVIRYVRRII